MRAWIIPTYDNSSAQWNTCDGDGDEEIDVCSYRDGTGFI